MTTVNRPPVESLACVNSDCISYGLARQSNITVRKTYGADHIRYLRCTHCGQEFSERKNTALFNCKIREARAIDVAEHLSEGVSLKGTARLTRTNPDTVRRIALKTGKHAQAFHNAQAQDLEISTLEMDERHGYVEDKTQQLWDAVSIDPKSKFIIQLEVGERNEALMIRLMEQSEKRLAHPQDLLLMTDGASTYSSQFPKIFGVEYFPPVKATPVDFPRLVIGFLIPSPMSKSSSIGRVRNWLIYSFAKPMAAGVELKQD